MGSHPGMEIEMGRALERMAETQVQVLAAVEQRLIDNGTMGRLVQTTELALREASLRVNIPRPPDGWSL